MKNKIKSISKRILADTITPVSIYLKVRDQFAGSVLLESSDYHGSENNLSYVCCDAISEFKATDGKITSTLLGSPLLNNSSKKVMDEFKDYLNTFDPEPLDTPFIHCGLFGYTTYQSARHFDSVEIRNLEQDIPEVHYRLFRFVIVLDHFKNECHLIQNQLHGDEDKLLEIEQLITQQSFPTFPFTKTSDTTSNLSDKQFLEMVAKGIKHCHLGDVFQVVMSRRFSNEFKGDEFEVYRQLRSLNPSPYAFYFDMGDFKLFGSSPEAQIVVADGKATIHPIAGTFKRSGDDAADAALAQELLADEKENSEHVMLVDLARNDLSKFCEQVEVEKFKEVQYFSHVIHLVSRVSGKIASDHHGLDVFSSTFPAGTLSGAPKIRAMELIDETESDARGFYGGAIGFVDFKGNTNHAIMIRTFMSKENKLHYQAGAGVVAESVPEKELQEVFNKIAALEEAIKQAESN